MDHHRLFTSPSPLPLVHPTSVYDLSDSEIIEKLGLLDQQASFLRERAKKSTTAAIQRINFEAGKEIQGKREQCRMHAEQLQEYDGKIETMETDLAKMKENRAATERDYNALDQQCRDRMVQHDNDMKAVKARKRKEEENLDPRRKKEWRMLVEQLSSNRHVRCSSSASYMSL
jgi:hypothetical protein